MIARPVSRDQRRWNKGLLVCQKKNSRTEARLVHSSSFRNRTIVARPCHLYSPALTGARRPFNRGRRSRDDFQRLDLVAFEPEEESKVDRATRKVSDKPTGNDGLSLFLIGRERLTCICVFCRSSGLPLLDGGQAVVGVAFVLHDGIFCEAPSNGLAVTFVFVGGEIGGDGFG